MEAIRAGGFMRAQPVETGKTAAFFSGKMKRYVKVTCNVWILSVAGK